MYICRECKNEYKEKVDYCECGNNTFDYIEDKKPQLSLEQKSEIISRIFFAICLVLSALVWLIPTKQPEQKTANKPKINNVKTVPDINKIWKDTTEQQPKVKEMTQPVVDYARR